MLSLLSLYSTPKYRFMLLQELSEVRGNKVSLASEKHAKWGGGLAMHTKPWVRARYVFCLNIKNNSNSRQEVIL